MKKLLFTCIFIILIIFSLIYPTQIIAASKQGILVWFEQILPALLPFTILSTLLIKSNFLKSFSKSGNLLAICITMCCGFVFGFPIGAKLASDFYKTNLLSKRQAILLSITTNNFSPMFVCGFVLPTLFPKYDFITSTYLFLYLIPLCLSACFLIFTYAKEQENICDKTSETFDITMSQLDNSILSGFETLIKLCGYIVLFSILAKITWILFPEQPFYLTILLENLEITNGIQMLSANQFDTKTTYILAIQILSFGGLSGIAQTNSVFSTSNLSIYKYIIGKVTLSLLLTLLAVMYVSYFNHF